MKPFFVTFEGIDGTGKTTQFNILAERFKALGRQVLLAKEPGDVVGEQYVGSELGKHVRQILFFSDVKDSTGILDEEARDLLFLADHIQLWKKTVVPALRGNRVVICDRYGDSQLAYTVGKKGSPWIDELYMARRGPTPDATVLLIGEPSFLKDRAKARQGSEAGKQDGKSWATDEAQRRIRDKYLTNLIDENRTIVINVLPGKSIEMVAHEIWSKVQNIYHDVQHGNPVGGYIWQEEQRRLYGKGPVQLELFPDGVKEAAYA
jgi:dTMP kinase